MVRYEEGKLEVRLWPSMSSKPGSNRVCSHCVWLQHTLFHVDAFWSSSDDRVPVMKLTVPTIHLWSVCYSGSALASACGAVEHCSAWTGHSLWSRIRSFCLHSNHWLCAFLFPGIISVNLREKKNRLTFVVELSHVSPTVPGLIPSWAVCDFFTSPKLYHLAAPFSFLFPLHFLFRLTVRLKLVFFFALMLSENWKDVVLW